MKKIARALIFIALLLIAYPHESAAEIIILKDGTKIEDYISKIENGKLYLVKKGEISKDDVKEIIFSSNKTAVNETKAKVDDREIKAIMKKAEEFQKAHSDQNGIVLMDDGYYEYKEDGSTLYRYHYQFKVLKEVKKHEANVTFYFIEGRERINVILARTISPDGNVFNLDQSKINISNPSSGGRSFSNYYTYNFELPNVEVGSIIDYIVEVEEYNPFEKKFFFPNFGFCGDEPILLSRLNVTIPESEKLYYVFSNFDKEHEKPKVFDSKGKKSYVWEYENMEPVISEPNMPSFRDVVPYITCALFDDWNVFYKWSEKFLKDKMKVTSEIEAKVAELTKDCVDDEERVARIYHFIQQSIRYISIKSSIGSGFTGHPAAETLKNEYGDCIDKAILFSAMLKAVDIDSYPIFLKTNNSNDLERRLPGFDSNHAITKVKVNGKTLFLDATAENFRYPYFQTADQGIWVINALEKKLEFIEVPLPEDNAEIIINNCAINKNGDFDVNSSGSYTGATEANERYYSKHLKTSDMMRYMTNYVNSISPGSQVKYLAFIGNNDIAIPYGFDFGYVLKNYGITAGDLVILSIPNIEKSFGEVALETRKFPLEFTSSSRSQTKYVIDLTGNYTVKYLPETLKIDSPYFSFNMEYKQENGKIIFTSDYSRKKREVPLADYAEYRKAHKEIERRLKEKIFLTKAVKVKSKEIRAQ